MILLNRPLRDELFPMLSVMVGRILFYNPRFSNWDAHVLFLLNPLPIESSLEYSKLF